MKLNTISIESIYCSLQRYQHYFIETFQIFFTQYTKASIYKLYMSKTCQKIDIKRLCSA